MDRREFIQVGGAVALSAMVPALPASDGVALQAMAHPDYAEIGQRYARNLARSMRWIGEEALEQIWVDVPLTVVERRAKDKMILVRYKYE